LLLDNPGPGRTSALLKTGHQAGERRPPCLTGRAAGERRGTGKGGADQPARRRPAARPGLSGPSYIASEQREHWISRLVGDIVQQNLSTGSALKFVIPGRAVGTAVDRTDNMMIPSTRSETRWTRDVMDWGTTGRKIAARKLTEYHNLHQPPVPAALSRPIDRQPGRRPRPAASQQPPGCCTMVAPAELVGLHRWTTSGPDNTTTPTSAASSRPDEARSSNR